MVRMISAPGGTGTRRYAELVAGVLSDVSTSCAVVSVPWAWPVGVADASTRKSAAGSSPEAGTR